MEPRVIRRIAPTLLLSLALAGCGPPARSPAPLAAPPEGRAAQVAAYARTLRGFRRAGWLPLIDMEVSLAGWADAAALVRAMNRAGVALAAVTGPDGGAIRAAHRRYPGRLVPLTAEAEQAVWADPAGSFLADTRRQLAAGAFGVGPIAFDPLPIGPRPPPERREVRESLEAVLRLAEEKNAPLWVRLEPEDVLLGRLERQLRSRPGAAVVWTRSGWIARPDLLPAYGPGLLRALSLRHPRLFFALTRRPPPEPSLIPRPRRHHLYGPAGALSPEWKALLESRITHFTSGSSGGGPPAPYVNRVRIFRDRVIDRLSPAARERLAFRNAWRILFGREWEEERGQIAPAPRPRG